MATSTIKLVDIFPFPEHMSGETFTAEVDGVKYKFEQWSTNNSGGLETYDEEGQPAEQDLPAEVNDAIGDLIDQWSEVFYAKWSERVTPVLAAIIEEIVAECEPATVEHEEES